MLESMFGDVDVDDLDPQQLETDATKNLCQQAGQAEEASDSKSMGLSQKTRLLALS